MSPGAYSIGGGYHSVTRRGPIRVPTKIIMSDYPITQQLRRRPEPARDGTWHTSTCDGPPKAPTASTRPTASCPTGDKRSAPSQTVPNDNHCLQTAMLATSDSASLRTPLERAIGRNRDISLHPPVCRLRSLGHRQRLSHLLTGVPTHHTCSVGTPATRPARHRTQPQLSGLRSGAPGPTQEQGVLLRGRCRQRHHREDVAWRNQIAVRPRLSRQHGELTGRRPAASISHPRAV